MKRRTVYLIVLGILLAAALYFVFRIFLTKTTFPYAYEIAAAFMGALVTVVITMILLNRQSEVETC
jgi:ABC-type Fe3+-siderophore transport system permease subunit